MKVGIFGTGIVGTTIASKLLANSHEVMIGSRSGSSNNLNALLNQYPETCSQGKFQDAAFFGTIIFNCVMGIYSLEAVRKSNEVNFKGKTIVDVTNPLDFSLGMPPRLTVCNDNSAGEMLQQLIPSAKVVKALNTVSYSLMTDPGKINNKNVDIFICGNDDLAKEEVSELLIKEFGWNRENIIDLGDIKHARSTEAYLLLASSLVMKYGTFNTMIKVFRA